MHPPQVGHSALESSCWAGEGVGEHYSLEEATWELEDAMRLAHPFLFNVVEH